MRIEVQRAQYLLTKELRYLLEKTMQNFLDAFWQEFPPPAPTKVAKQAKELSERYNSLSPQKTYGKPQLVEARLHFFMPTDIPKIWLPALELLLAKEMYTRTMLRVLDIGAGVGTAGAGLLVLLKALGFSGKIELFAMEPDLVSAAKLPAVMRVCSRTTGIKLELQRVDWRLQEFLKLKSARRFDIITMLNTLAEVCSPENYVDQVPGLILRLLANNVTKDGGLIVIEPALKRFSRLLSLTRDRLMKHKLCLFSPCICQGPCPETKTAKQFCFHSIRTTMTPYLQSVAAHAGLSRHEVNFSFLTLTRNGPSLIEWSGKQKPNCGRVVSFPKRVKKGSMIFVCAQQGLLNVFVPRKLTENGMKDKQVRHGSLVCWQHHNSIQGPKHNRFPH